MTVTRLAVEFEMQTPIAAPQRDNVWLLERWLAGAAALERFPRTMTMRYPGLDDWVPEEALDIPLAREAASGVFSTTQAQFPWGGEPAVHYRTKKPIIAVLPTTSFALGSGILKQWHVKQPLWAVPAVRFIADVTDLDRFFNLLTILRDNGLGGDRTRGYGQIYDIQVHAAGTADLDEVSCAWTVEGLPTRPIPWARVPPPRRPACEEALAAGSLRLQHQRLEAPAWAARNQILCVGPHPDWPTAFVTTASRDCHVENA